MYGGQHLGRMTVKFDILPQPFDHTGGANKHRRPQDAHKFLAVALTLTIETPRVDHLTAHICQQGKIQLVFGGKDVVRCEIIRA